MMSEFLEKICCCWSIKIGGYILGVSKLLNLGALIVYGIEIDKKLKLGVDVVGQGKNEYISKHKNVLKYFDFTAFIVTRIIMAIIFGIEFVAAVLFLVGLKVVKIFLF